jgi:hypothetical protein
MSWALFAERLAPGPDAIGPNDTPPPGMSLKQRQQWANGLLNAKRLQDVLYPED